ncbi:BMP family ABC transporter substrate-binding protein [Maridesulfovibrio sp.]|uniref:BMP family lipoprotein n=1 Tax=Maridesulfovibrio sp. TaxID=2795000 RepID=UPI002A188A16|nr:BMP family ABC transporter substrate-binding protein [Maridesulfovibrio sp.]
MKKTVSHLALAVILLAFGLACACPSPCFAHKFVVGFVASGSAIDDDSFNSMTVAGLRKLEKNNHVRIEVRQGGFSLEEHKKQIKSLLDCGAQVIVINFSSDLDKLLEFISQYPEIPFIINDARVSGYANVSSTVYNQRMGSCLVGALCAWQTATDRIGFIGANEMPIIKDFLCGFKEGIRLSDRDVQIETAFVRRGNNWEGFEDPEQASVIAARMYNSGVDIIYAVAGLSGNGVIAAARKSGNYVIGVDSDQDGIAKGTVLTSMMKRLDVAVYNEVLSVLEGRFIPGPKEYNISNNGIGLTEMKYSKDLIAEDVLQKLAELKEKLSKGLIRLDCPDK